VRQASQNGIPLVYCNNVGVQNNGKDALFTYDGCSCMYDATGKSITDSPAFAEDLLVADWDPDTGAIRGKRGLQPVPSDTAALYTALRYGAATFLQQLGIQKMTIGVSGGIDSAVTAAFYVDILGPENVLLVNMPSQYNSALTKGLAQQMAQALGTHYTIIPIQEAVDHTIRQFGETPVHNYGTGGDQCLTVSSFATENIQARDRGARVLAGLASLFGGGFSCNSNKAEMTVGYATFYGDIAGVLALIGDCGSTRYTSWDGISMRKSSIKK
jgi:NAD+ synthase (glutamine-hydrolysing)